MLKLKYLIFKIINFRNNIRTPVVANASRNTNVVECPICLQNVNIKNACYCKNRPCNAYYHKLCIERWKTRNNGI